MACTRSRSFFATLCLAVASVATVTRQTATNAVATVYTLCVRAAEWVIARVATTVAKILVQPPHVPRVAMALLQARAFVLRLAKRETPRVTPGWRMCPSI